MKTLHGTNGLNRRRFLLTGAALSGGLLVGCSAPSSRDRVGTAALLPPVPGTVALNGWVRIGTDGRVTVALPRTEMGQGIATALPLLVAEELDARWEDMHTEQAPLDRLYANSALMLNVLPFGVDDDGWVARTAQNTVRRVGLALNLQVTGGSSSIRDAWEPLRLAGAAARHLLVQAAAAQWQVPASECSTEPGTVVHAASGRRAPYGTLAQAATGFQAPAELPLKPPEQYRLIGHGAPRLDLPDKVNGRAQFGLDTRVEGMLHAAIALPEVMGATVKSFDDQATLKVPGVTQVVQVPQGVAVLADRWWQARQGVMALKVEWTESPHASLSSDGIRRQFDTALKDQTGTRFRHEGDGAQALEGAARQLDATYWAPFLAHAALEPIHCVAQVQGGRVTLWGSTQVAALAAWRASQLADVPFDHVTLHVPYVGGGFGRRLEVDMVEQAVAIALQAQGRPVKLVWTREQDTRHDVYRPAALSHFRAGLDAQGQIRTWVNKVTAPSVGRDSFNRLLPWAAADTPDKNQIEGAFDIPYQFPHIEVRQVRVQTPVPVGYWRSVGHSYNAFFTESFMDELAHAAGKDPLAFRLSLLKPGSRHARLLQSVGEQAGWGQPLPAGRARGVALHESFGSLCAQVAEVSVEQGAVKVHRVVCALDCGVVVDPDTVKAQMEGGIVFGLSAALFGEITVKDGRIEQGNFSEYEVVRLRTMPRIEVHLQPSAHPPGGVGEPGTPPIAPAVTNALFALTGQRVRSLPIRLEPTAPSAKA